MNQLYQVDQNRKKFTEVVIQIFYVGESFIIIETRQLVKTCLNFLSCRGRLPDQFLVVVQLNVLLLGMEQLVKHVFFIPSPPQKTFKRNTFPPCWIPLP